MKDVLPLVGIPIKPFGVAKQRLDSLLSPAKRSALGKAVASHTISVARTAIDEVVVITGDPGVAQWAERLGITSFAEGSAGRGLNGAAASFRDFAVAAGRAWLILHADLPAISHPDVAALLTALESGPVLSPSYDGGTTACGAKGHMEFAYGPASFHRHLRALPDATVVSRPGLALDLDTVADLQAAAKANAWIRTALDSPP